MLHYSGWLVLWSHVCNSSRSGICRLKKIRNLQVKKKKRRKRDWHTAVEKNAGIVMFMLLSEPSCQLTFWCFLTAPLWTDYSIAVVWLTNIFFNCERLTCSFVLYEPMPWVSVVVFCFAVACVRSGVCFLTTINGSLD